MEAIIEISKGTMNKYEVQKDSGRIKLDRVLFSSVVYPENYGYIEKTLCDDGDPIDVLVITTQPLIPGCLVDIRIIGGLDMIDDGEKDTKLICVAEKDPRLNHVKKLGDLGEHKLKEIAEFFRTYKNLQPNKIVEIKEWFDVKTSKKIYEESIQLYKEKN